MNERQRKRNRKWLALGAAGFVSGALTLALARSLPMASGSAAAAILGMIVLKHLALFVAGSSPAAAIWQTMKPRLRAWCGQPPDDQD